MMVLTNGMPRRNVLITGVLVKATLKKSSYGTKITISLTLCIVIINSVVHMHTTTTTQMRTVTTTLKILMSLRSNGKNITTLKMKTLTNLIATGLSMRIIGKSNLTLITKRTKRKRRSLQRNHRKRPIQVLQQPMKVNLQQLLN